MRIKFYYLLAVALIFAGTHALAQSSRYRFSQLDISNGLSHNQVNCIFKDSEGFMWFGTASGLNRFDGYTFKVFKHDSGDKNSVTDDFIARIFEGPDKKLWISTRNGYCFYDPATEQFNGDMSSLLHSLKLPVYPNVIKILRASATDFWFLYPDSGIYRYNVASKQTKRYYHSGNSASSIYSGSITDITADAKGNIWIVYSDATVELFDVKLNKVSYRTDAFSKVIKSKSTFYSLTVDRDNDLWFYGSYMSYNFV